MQTQKILADAQHEEQPALILGTKDYDMFKVVKGNREVNMNHVNNLTQTIAKNNLLYASPIIVNEKMEVIDGQHRLKAAEVNGWMIYYVVAQGTSLEDVQEVNTYKKVWTSPDYIKSYATIGKPDYILMNDIMEEYHVTPEMVMSFSGIDTRGANYKKLRAGKLTYGDEQKKKFDRAYSLYLSTAPFFPGGIPRSPYYYRAIMNIADKDMDKSLVTKLEKSQMVLRRQATTKDYLRQFEDVLNWKTQGEAAIRLF